MKKAPKKKSPPTIDIAWLPPADLRPNPRNPNAHSAEQVRRLADIIQYQGWRHPIIVSNLSGLVVSGHCRLEAARLLKLDRVPVSRQDFESEDQEYAFLIADNAIASWSELDLPAIELNLPELRLPTLDLLGIRNFQPGGSAGFDPNEEWAGMPDFVQNDKRAFKTVQLHFHDQAGVNKFAELIGQKIGESTRYIWYPDIIIEKAYDKKYDAKS